MHRARGTTPHTYLQLLPAPLAAARRQPRPHRPQLRRVLQRLLGLLLDADCLEDDVQAEGQQLRGRRSLGDLQRRTARYMSVQSEQYSAVQVERQQLRGRHALADLRPGRRGGGGAAGGAEGAHPEDQG